MSNKQSSVEWLIEQLIAPCRGIPSHIIEQAKAMHEEEIKDAHTDGFHTPLDYFNSDNYYTETFRSNQPPTPDPKLIDSMAMRYRHDFGLLSESEKESIRITMKQIWEEIAGLGFYKP